MSSWNLLVGNPKMSCTYKTFCFFINILLVFKNSINSVVEWLKCQARDQHGLGSKPTHITLLRPWERHFTAHFPAWWFSQAVLIVISLLNYKRTAISSHLQKQVGVIAYPMY